MNAPLSLGYLKSELDRIGGLIAAFEKQTAALDLFPLTIEKPQLNDGEIYVGLIASADGSQRHHLVLLPGDKDDIEWQDALDWAKEQGGDLPNRIEQSMLFATQKDQFEERAYWSNAQYEQTSVYAWYQDFNLGNQYCNHERNEFRARAVRRIAI